MKAETAQKGTKKRGAKAKTPARSVEIEVGKEKGKANVKGNGHDEEKDGFSAGPINDNIKVPDDSKRRRREAEQQELVPDRKIPALHDAALNHKANVADFKAATAKVTESKTQLIDQMHAHGKEVYICDGIKVTLKKTNETVKVELLEDDDQINLIEDE
jgi:hypothetical protein